MLNSDAPDVPNDAAQSYGQSQYLKNPQESDSSPSQKHLMPLGGEQRGMKKFSARSSFFSNVFGDPHKRDSIHQQKKENPSIMKSKYPSLNRQSARGDPHQDAPMFSKTVFNPKTKFVGTVQGGFYRGSKDHMQKSGSNYRVRPSFSQPGIKLPFAKSVMTMGNEEDSEYGMPIPNKKKFDVDSLHDNYRKVNPLSGR